MATESAPLRIALVYDFDGTLARGNIQEQSLIPQHLGMSPKDFWDMVSARTKQCDAEQILIYAEAFR